MRINFFRELFSSHYLFLSVSYSLSLSSLFFSTSHLSPFTDALFLFVFFIWQHNAHLYLESWKSRTQNCIFIICSWWKRRCGLGKSRPPVFSSSRNGNEERRITKKKGRIEKIAYCCWKFEYIDCELFLFSYRWFVSLFQAGIETACVVPFFCFDSR